MRHFLCRLFVMVWSVCFIPTVARAVECESGQYFDDETCVACPATNSNSQVSYNSVAAIKSEVGATSSSQCYFDVTKGGSTSYSSQYVKYANVGIWYIEYAPGTKCYWNVTERVYSDCTQKKIFLSCPVGSFVDNGTPLNDEFTNRCTLCAPGTYSQTNGTNEGDEWTTINMCSVCPAGSTSPAGASHVNQCVPCADGTYLSDGVCKACPNGVICTGGVMTCAMGQFLNGASCDSCPDNYPFSVADATSINECYVVTDPGTYVPGPHSDVVKCAQGEYCPGNVVVYYGYGRYRAVEWIKSDGSAYIDTGIVTRPEYEYRMRSTLTGAEKGHSTQLLGARISGTSSQNAFMLFSSVNQGGIRYDRYGVGVEVYPSSYSVLRDGLFHKLKMTPGSAGGLFVDDTKIASNKTPNTQIGTYNVMLFGGNNGGAIMYIDSINKIKSYTVVDTNTDTIVQNFVAVYDNATDTYGMYDTVSATFYGNAGAAGAFIGGGFIGTEYLGNVGGNYSCADATAGVAPSSLVGAKSVDNCGRILHIGDNGLLLMHRDKRTSPTFVMQYGDNKFYADMKPVSDGARGRMRAQIGDIVYSIYNMDFD